MDQSIHFSQQGGEIDEKYYKGTYQASLMKYQCVTSHGNETVSDADSPTAIGHSPGVVKLTPIAFDPNDPSTQQGVVHIPIHNPPTVTQASVLQSLQVQFKSNNAWVESLSLYYDKDIVFSAKTEANKTFHLDLTNREEFTKATYLAPRGICLQLTLSFPGKDSVIELYSVTLTYQAG